jgi:hypothetical protein
MATAAISLWGLTIELVVAVEQASDVRNDHTSSMLISSFSITMNAF